MAKEAFFWIFAFAHRQLDKSDAAGGAGCAIYTTFKSQGRFGAEAEHIAVISPGTSRKQTLDYVWN